VKYSDRNGKQIWEHQESRLARDAQRRAREIALELDRSGGYWQAPDASTSVREYVDAWADRVDVREQTRDEYKRILAAEEGFLADYGHLPLAALRGHHIRTWMGTRAQAGASRLTIRNGIAPVRAALAEAVDESRIRENPAAIRRTGGKKAAIPGRAPKRIVAPESRVVTKALAGAEGAFKVVLLLAGACGLRRGEIYGLQWGDVSDDWRTLTIRRSNIAGRMQEPKTEAGIRTVPLFASARAELREHKMRSGFKAADDLIICDVLGRPLIPANEVRRERADLFEKVGLPEDAFRFHDLRHFAVSQLVRDHVDILLLSRIAGHSDPSITLRVYSHLMTADVEAAADAHDPIAATR
jgi:integrase